MRSALIAVLFLLTMAPAAAADSIAYIDGGEVWLSSLDGAQKVRLATHVVNSSGETEKWLAVAASDSGRIVAARNVPGRISRFSWFKVWEPNGTSTVEGPLNAPTGWVTYVYPLGFDVTADGVHMVYGYSNSSSCCPISFAQGTYVRPVTNSSLDPINVSGQEHPTLFGNRMIANTGETVNVQDASAAPYGTDFTPWIDFSATGLELRRTDVAANGQLLAAELEQWNGGTQEIGKIAVVAAQGVDQSPTFPASVDCFVPTAGVAKDASLSLDATRIAWTDDGRPQGGGRADDQRRPVRDELSARRDLTDRLPGRHRRGERGGVPARVRSAAGRRPTARRPAVGRAGGDRAEKGHGEGPGPRQGGADQGQGRPRGQGQGLRRRAGEGPEKQQIHRCRHRVDDREARRDCDGEAAADQRGAQEAEPLEGRANDAACDPGQTQHHQARHAPLTLPTVSQRGAR